MTRGAVVHRAFLAAIIMFVCLSIVYICYGMGVVNSLAGVNVRTGHGDGGTAALVTPTLLSEDMVLNFQAERQKMIDRLKISYGKDNFENIFTAVIGGTKVSRGRLIIKSPADGPSWDRLKRKLVIKLLQTQHATKATPFIWATAGHSTAAGHGNLFHEAYTNVMERAVKDLFAAVGINFVGRNYGMSGTDSAPEYALCVKEILGLDADVVTWDFDQTDGRNLVNMELYFYRVALHRNRPALIAFHHQVGKMDNARKDIMKQKEDNGLTALYFDSNVFDDSCSSIPDTLGMTQEQIDRLPPFVRNFKCDGSLEAGEPFCFIEKYNKTECPTRRYMVKWHKGWKWHALKGILASLFLMDLLDDAVKEISSTEMDPKVLLAELEEQEKVDYERFANADLPSNAKDILTDTGQDDVNVSLLFKGPSFCHTARLPAEIRFKGILTESTKVGFDPYNISHPGYDQGMMLSEADAEPNEGEAMRLVYDELTRDGCPAPSHIDFRDFFYLKQEEGWKHLTLPTDAELREYGTGQPLRGLIAVCFLPCPYDNKRKCEAENVIASGVNEGLAEFQVNGQPVANLTKIDVRCQLMKGVDGHFLEAQQQWAI